MLPVEYFLCPHKCKNKKNMKKKNWFCSENKTEHFLFLWGQAKAFSSAIYEFPQNPSKRCCKTIWHRHTHTLTHVQTPVDMYTLLCDLVQTCYPCHILRSSRLTINQSRSQQRQQQQRPSSRILLLQANAFHAHTHTHTHSSRLIPLLTLAKHFNRRPPPSPAPGKQHRQLKVVIAAHFPLWHFPLPALLIALSGFSPLPFCGQLKTKLYTMMKIKSVHRHGLDNGIGSGINQSDNHLINYSKSHSTCGGQQLE